MAHTGGEVDLIGNQRGPGSEPCQGQARNVESDNDAGQQSGAKGQAEQVGSHSSRVELEERGGHDGAVPGRIRIKPRYMYGSKTCGTREQQRKQSRDSAVARGSASVAFILSRAYY